jgi:hypothetical protein
MIPLGYRTIPEALHLLEQLLDNRDALEWLEAGLLDGELQLFTQRTDERGVEVVRIPWEDVTALSKGWGRWLSGGRAPVVPDPDHRKSNAEWEAWLVNPDTPMPEKTYHGWTTEHKYAQHRLLLEDSNFRRWLNAFSGEPPEPCAKTGAPGRPTSMHLVLAEHKRRVVNNLTDGSRTAEAKALSEWLAVAHPESPPLTYKSILNKLPPEFQPLTALPK